MHGASGTECRLQWKPAGYCELSGFHGDSPLERGHILFLTATSRPLECGQQHEPAGPIAGAGVASRGGNMPRLAGASHRLPTRVRRQRRRTLSQHGHRPCPFRCVAAADAIRRVGAVLRDGGDGAEIVGFKRLATDTRRLLGDPRPDHDCYDATTQQCRLRCSAVPAESGRIHCCSGPAKQFLPRKVTSIEEKR